VFKRFLGWLRGSSSGEPAAVAPLAPMVSRAELVEALRAFLSARSRRKIPAAAIDPSAPLLERGYLDSLAIVAFLAHIHRTYGVRIRAIQLGGALATLDALADFVLTSRTSGSEPAAAASVPFHVPATRASEPVFVPAADVIARSQLTAFEKFVASRTAREFADAAAFHAFSVEEFRTFWKLFLEWSALEVAGHPEPVCDGDAIEHAKFFPALRLSYARALLRDLGSDDAPALTACTESGEPTRLTRGELRRRVCAAAGQLKTLGVRAGDRVVAIANNDADAVIACLASVALGAAWSAVSPDLGREAVLARFEQLAPAVLFYSRHYVEQGRTIDVTPRAREILAGLPTVKLVVSLGDDQPALATPVVQTSLRALERGDALALADLELFPFDHPLFILFSSGTTGRPKCIVHGAGGTLLEHVKEHRLHGDLRPDDKLFFHTTCAWMMWNWQLSALAVGAEIVLYAGAVSYPDTDALWQLVARERVTVFGTSPAFLQFTQTADVHPSQRAELSRLRAILSTGAMLPDTAFDWILAEVARVPVQSISGGTDIIGCFLLGHPNLPVYAGELQAKSLGLDVRALGATAEAPIGELVCANPFPSRPLGLFADPAGERFHEAYFAQNPGLWTHGDRFEWTARGTGRIHGRSDGVMNVRGVRIGPAEIYGALAGIENVVEAMAVEQIDRTQGADGRMLLLVVLDGGRGLDAELASKVREAITTRCSPAHVPDTIIQVTELPTTHNGKRAERAARDAANGLPVVNVQSLRNPACLAEISAALAAPARTW
jgi:acetoacetyl-CoA synthetase